MSLNQEQFALLSRGIIDLRGPIDEDSFDYVRSCITALVANDAPAVTVWITSDGGSIKYGLSIYDMLRNYPGYVTGLVIGKAYSIALVILQGCDERQAYANATVFLHDPIYTVGYSILAQHIKTQDISEFESMRRRMISILKQRSKLPLRQINRLCRDNTTLYADQAKKAGFLDVLV